MPILCVNVSFVEMLAHLLS